MEAAGKGQRTTDAPGQGREAKEEKTPGVAVQNSASGGRGGCLEGFQQWGSMSYMEEESGVSRRKQGFLWRERKVVAKRARGRLSEKMQEEKDTSEKPPRMAARSCCLLSQEGDRQPRRGRFKMPPERSIVRGGMTENRGTGGVELWKDAGRPSER